MSPRAIFHTSRLKRVLSIAQSMVGPHPRLATSSKCSAQLGWRGENYFFAIQLCTFWADFACIPASSSNLVGGLASNILGSSSAPCATWPILFGQIVLHLCLLIQIVRRLQREFACIPASSSNFAGALNSGHLSPKIIPVL